MLHSRAEEAICKTQIKYRNVDPHTSNLRLSTDEYQVMTTFVKNLIRVAQIRYEYPSVPCDCCEQLKNTKDIIIRRNRMIYTHGRKTRN